MKSKKFLACLMAGAMVLSMAACGNNGSADADTDVDIVEEAFAYDDAASITFADGNYAFLGSDSTVNPAAKTTVFELVDRNEQKAVKITSEGADKIYAGIQMDALLGDNLDKVATVDMIVESETGDAFASTSGKIYSFSGEASDVKNSTDWSIYLEAKNPKVISAKVPAAVEGNYLVLSLEVNATGSAMSKDVPTALYLYSISFKDADGNVLAVDTTAEYKAVSNNGPDRSNLFSIASYVDLGMATSAGEWAQDGVVLTEEQIEALVPGTVLEFEFSSASGQLWAVIPWAQKGWMRVGQFDAYINDSKTVCQITYEQIAAICGEDKSTWGSADGLCIQAESDTAWEVYSCKIGTVGTPKKFVASANFDMATSAGEWAQDGIVLTDEQVAMLVPGTVLKFSYTSESGNLWAVMPWAEKGWMRVGQAGTDDEAVCDGSSCYVTYEQIAALCGDDVSKWGSADGLCIQAESDSAWEVYSLEIGTLEDAVEYAFVGSCSLEWSGSAGEWAQDGPVLTEEQIAALVPGSVIKFSYTSESGNLWAVMPWAEKGWMRVGQAGSGDDAVCDGSTCYVTYEQIAAICGDDVSKWGSADGICIQAESDTAWEVYSIEIGTLVEAPKAPAVRGLTDIEMATSAGEWAQDGVVLTEDQVAKLVSGSVIKLNYSSISGNLWVVIPWAEKGWIRVGQNGSGDDAICTGSTCYVTYEQIAALCGDDVSKWGSADGICIQAESDTAWEVYSAAIGMAN